ncbi:hypothetical protein AeMF1_003574 [Aphanomyces euteiches]|nr:hypothetical protein AeMF1_003574 [Aphanomyces euteiches]
MEEFFMRLFATIEQQQQQINQLLQTQTQTQARLVENQQVLQERLLQQQEQAQAAPTPVQRDTERRVEGLSMPSFHGRINESIGLYIHRVETFFKTKNLNYMEDKEVEARCLAMVVANLKGQAAAWYQELASHEGGSGLTALSDFEKALRKAFGPDDLKERLRDKLFSLQQNNCKGQLEHIEKFRRICTEVRDMSELDKVTFTRGLRLKTREEVKYRQCQTLSSAIKTALEYERARAVSLGIVGKSERPFRAKRLDRDRERHEERPPSRSKQREPDDMEVDNIHVRREHKKDHSKLRCYNCQKIGHIASECRKPKRRVSGQPPTSRQNNVEVQEELSPEDFNTLPLVVLMSLMRMQVR